MQKGKKKVVGFTCGTFDLTHAGHFLMFKECREQCDWLIVAIQEDPSVDRLWKHKPVQTLKERHIQVGACRYVDQILHYKTEHDLYELLKKITIDVRFVGADWKKRVFTGHDLPIKVVYNSRGHHYSSSNLRERVKQA